MSRAAARYTSIGEVRTALYPRMARLVTLDPRELIGWPWRPSATGAAGRALEGLGAQSKTSTEEEP